MKILWLAPEPPIDPLTGGRERSRRMLAYVAVRHEVHLACRVSAFERPELVALRKDLAGLTTLFYDSGERPGWKRWLNRMRVRLLFNRVRPDAIHVQTPTMSYLSPRRGGGSVVVDFHDVPTGPLDERRIDVAIAVCEEDRARLQTMISVERIYVLPNGVDLAFWSAAVSQPQQLTVLFPAALNWRPNHEAAMVLIEEVLPRIQARIPEVQLVIAGRMPCADLLDRAGRNAAVMIVPDPQDMRAYFAKASVIVVPVTGVSGTRLKILQALTAGRPVVSTPEGARGLGLGDGVHLLIAKMGQAFADAVCRLLADPLLCQSLIDNGRRVIDRYDWANFLPVLDEIYPP